MSKSGCRAATASFDGPPFIINKSDNTGWLVDGKYAKNFSREFGNLLFTFNYFLIDCFSVAAWSGQCDSSKA